MALFGAMVGSFLNVVAYRMPAGTSVVLPPSACPACGHRIRAWENIPILSWIALRGRCSACHGDISPRYPAVEALAAVLAVLAYLHFGWTLRALEASAYLWVLLVLALIDWDTRLLPNRITLPGIGAGLALGALGLLHRDWSLVPLPHAALGALIGYALIWIPDRLYRLVRHRRGFGGGDRKMLALIGAWLGPLAVCDAFALAVCAGAILGGLWAAIRRRQIQSAIPFGPFLAIGGAVVLFFRPRWF
ncbi:prepilin peptidase [Acidithiobacillus caldus ATCC 51756]|uniref:prepilin peptidase n=1 Tax=Acidithiobacillus caldus TaxID=33059 RepID=UPI001C06D142|nr:A24 family peptidase [Acidithiobacillus caldus]MBU2734280.1 prepilin peptidase [Acidithiobacillus caldus ATCC 51756]MBU2801738.1 prepilin peptidase [Acidithiobacillus caldus]